jgi:hypothetical protein
MLFRASRRVLVIRSVWYSAVAKIYPATNTRRMRWLEDTAVRTEVAILPNYMVRRVIHVWISLHQRLLKELADVRVAYTQRPHRCSLRTKALSALNSIKYMATNSVVVETMTPDCHSLLIHRPRRRQ